MTTVSVTIDKNGVIQVAAPGPQGTKGDAGQQLPGMFRPENYGAERNGVTNDQAAFVAMFAAMNASILAGDGGTALLSGGTYLVDGALLPPPGCAIIGEGPSSVLKTTQNQMVLKLLLCEDSTFENFTIEGNSTGVNQNGIESGFLGGDGANRILCVGVTVRNMGGRGFSFAYGPSPLPGPIVVGCRVIDCAGQAFAGYMQTTFIGCHATGCGVGLFVGSGNVTFDGGDLTANTVGVSFAVSGNDGHGIVSNTKINHCTSYGVDVGALVNGHTFSACMIYQSPIRLVGNAGVVKFVGCDIDPSTYTFDNSLTKFASCTFPEGYGNVIAESNNPDTEFDSDCRGLHGSIPSFIGQRRRIAYTFPTDADQVLTKQQSRAETIDIVASVISTTRSLRNARSPADASRTVVANRTAHTVVYRWLTGAGIEIPSLQTAIVDGDGSKAVCTSISSNVAVSTGTVDPSTLSLSGWYRGSYSGAPWLGSTSVGASGSRSLVSDAHDPAAGPALNGYTPAQFDGIDERLKDFTTLTQNYISTTAYRVVMLVNIGSEAAPAGSIYDNPGLVTESGGEWGIVVNSDGVSCYHESSGYKIATQSLPTGSWHVIDVSYNGTNLTVYVDDVSGTPVAAGTLGSIAGTVLRVGTSFNNGTFLDGQIIEIMIAPTAMGSTTPAQFVEYFNDRYGLVL